MTPKQLAEEAANKSWGEPQNGLASKGKMQDAVTAALSTFAEAQAEEFRRLAAEAKKRQTSYYEMGGFTPAVGESERARAFIEAAQMLEEKLS